MQLQSTMIQPKTTSVRSAGSFSVIIVVFLALMSGWGSPVAAALEAGAAKMEMTPPVGTPLDGEVERFGRPATGTHDPLWARTVYLEDEDTKVFLVSLDLYAIPADLRARVVALMPDLVPPQNVIITATNTHNSIGGLTEKIPFRMRSGRYHPQLLEQIARDAIESMQRAYSNRERASIGYGTVRHEVLSGNRYADKGLIDNQIGGISIEDADGNHIAIIGNFAAQADTAPQQDRYLFSADYPGKYYESLEAMASAGCVALFLNGAMGDQVPGNPEDKAGWDLTESIGRLLAVRVKEIANKVVCQDASISLGYAEAALPPTMVSDLMPEKAVIQTLEINDLVLTFLPGEPHVAIALALREQARKRGYKQQFTVGLANDYLHEFAPKNAYSSAANEAKNSFYGPLIDAWLYQQFDNLLTRGEVPAIPEGELKLLDTIAGCTQLMVRGNDFVRGELKGSQYRDALNAFYQTRIVDRVEAQTLLPQDSLWSWWPAWLNPRPLAMNALGLEARPALEEISSAQIDQLAGVASGASLPFDALWLTQQAWRFHQELDEPAPYPGESGAFVAVVGDRAGADDLLAGVNIAWPFACAPVIEHVFPEEGHAYVQIGYQGGMGVVCGMNDAGLVCSVQKLTDRPDIPTEQPSPEMVLESMLTTVDSVKKARALLADYEKISGLRLMVAGFNDDKADALILQHDETVTPAEKEDGLLVAASSPAVAGERDRGKQVREFFAEERIINADEVKSALQEEPLLNAATEHCIVFVPKKRELYIATRNNDQTMGEYSRIGIALGDSHE